MDQVRNEEFMRGSIYLKGRGGYMGGLFDLVLQRGRDAEEKKRSFQIIQIVIFICSFFVLSFYFLSFCNSFYHKGACSLQFWAVWARVG